MSRDTVASRLVEQVLGRVAVGGREGVKEGAVEVLATALPRTPLRDADLRATGDTGAEDPVVDGDEGYHQEVSFGTDYGAVQEKGYWETGPLAGVQIKNYTTPGTGREFLSSSVLEEAPRLAPRIARHVKRALES